LTKVDELGSAGSGTMSGMENIQAQIQALLTSVRRQRFAIVGLATLLAGSFHAGCADRGAVAPTGDATFDTITCKGWKVVDKDGKIRILAGTTADGETSVIWRDKDGNARINAGTTAHGTAGVAWADKDEKPRITASTSAAGDADVVWLDEDGKRRLRANTSTAGTAGVVWWDRNGKVRITAGTSGVPGLALFLNEKTGLADGVAGVVWLDKDEKPRITASTSAAGSVVYPTATGK
jgi:hypothetical protein